MSNIDKRVLTDESARESGNILLIVAARMARRELFTPLHYIRELPQKSVSMRVFREALERSEETLQREVCKIVDGHDRMQKKLKEAEEKLEAAEKRIGELEDLLFSEIRLWTQRYDAANGRRGAAEKRVAELEASHSKLRESMAAIHNTIRRDGAHTSLAVILNAAKRAHDESAAATGIRINGEG